MMISGCTTIITSAKRQAIARLMMQAMSTAEAVWMTRDIRSPTSDLTCKNKYGQELFFSDF
jgi:hypothetical protein